MKKVAGPDTSSILRNATVATLAVASLLLLPSMPARGAEPRCSAYMMDVSSELELFAGPSVEVAAGKVAQGAPEIEVGKLYAVKLVPQAGVTYPSPPSAKPIDRALPGGLLRFTVQETGRYRVSADANFWIDVLFEGKPLEATDFRSDRECAGPRKIVTFNLQQGAEMVLQLIDVRTPAIRLTVTPMPQAEW